MEITLVNIVLLAIIAVLALLLYRFWSFGLSVDGENDMLRIKVSELTYDLGEQKEINDSLEHELEQLEDRLMEANEDKERLVAALETAKEQSDFKEGDILFRNGSIFAGADVVSYTTRGFLKDK